MFGSNVWLRSPATNSGCAQLKNLELKSLTSVLEHPSTKAHLALSNIHVFRKQHTRLKGTVSAYKDLPGYRTKNRELLKGTQENNILPP